jgi:hypothetical protein
MRFSAVPQRLNLIINHCTLSGIALNRCWAQLFLMKMQSKKRYEFKNQKEKDAWLNTSGASHLENSEDVFVKPIKWGLFEWNAENRYPIENAISLHEKEVNDIHLVCRPVAFL